MTNTAILKIAETGDVSTAGDEDLIFSSALKTLKTKNSTTIAPNGAAYTHSLGYIPIHLYAGYLSSKQTYIGFIGQNTVDNNTYVQMSTTQVTNNNNDAFASSALIYTFWEQLI